VQAYLNRGRAVLLAATLGLTSAGLAPATAQDCGAPVCLRTELSPDLATQLGSGGVTLEALAGGLSLGYVGPNPIAVRLVAARYDNGRLVRYGVSARTMVSADQAVAITDAAAVLADAFEPATHRVVQLGAVEGEAARPIALNAFVGNVPPSNLGGEPGKALLTPEEAAAYTGSIGVIVLEPDDPALRDGAAAGSVGALVQLTLVRP
jgi:hypothetical protein